MSITFRPIQKHDLPLLLKIYSSTRETELAPVPWSIEEKQQFLKQQFEAQHSYYQEYFPQAKFLIIQKKGAPIGRLYRDNREDEIRLIDIALLPEFRGKGIGGKLLSEILAEAKRRDVLVRIHVEMNNPALHLYKRLGFRSIEEQGIYFLMEWQPNPEMVEA